jgi:preprotein translocase subunit SecE
MQNIGKFFRNVNEEMRKVRWPNKKELTKYTITVVTTLVLFTIFFALVDLGISALINLIQ